MDFTPMDVEATAAERALQCPEILELILRSLSPVDLILQQRTSQLWYGTIATSPHIQRTMFMRPDWQLEAKRNNPKREVNKPGERPRNNLLLRKVLGDSYPTMTLKLVSPKAQEDEFLVRDPYELSPDIVPQKPTDRESSLSGYWAWDVSIAFPADRLPDPAKNPAIYYENASWRKMFLSQPPATSLHLSRRWQRAANAAVEDQDGITMGTFMDRALKAKDAWNEVFIGSDRDWHFEGPIKFSHFEVEDQE